MDYLPYYMTTWAGIIGLSALFCVYRYYLGNRLTAQAAKLKSQMANIKQQFPELEERRGEIVAEGLGDIGINGIMNELGIDPKILNNPLVRGLVDRYAPKIIEQLSKNAKNTKTEESSLL